MIYGVCRSLVGPGAALCPPITGLLMPPDNKGVRDDGAESEEQGEHESSDEGAVSTPPMLPIQQDVDGAAATSGAVALAVTESGTDVGWKPTELIIPLC